MLRCSDVHCDKCSDCAVEDQLSAQEEEKQ